MITRKIKLESKEFGALVGQEIEVRSPETLEDCRSLVANGDSDVVARFGESIVRAQNNTARARVGKILKDDKIAAGDKLAALQAIVTGYKYSERAEGSGVPAKPKTPKGIANSKAASSGNRLFEKCAADEQFLARMVKQGIVDQAEFAEWTTARAAMNAPKTAETPASK